MSRSNEFGVERSAPAGAVFLSYASQDADAARRICEALRSGGVEVWFDADGGLEHGDEWDAKIRRQIKECVLFIPLISANTQARHEGYFRLEWDLAAERARTIASGVPFILPIVIDATREPDALVPDRFRMVQWTRVRGGELTPEVTQRLLKLWSHRVGLTGSQAPSGSATPAGDHNPHLAGDRAADVAKRRRVPRAGYALAGAGLVIALLALLGPWARNGGAGPGGRQPAPGATALPTAETAELLQRIWKLVDDPGRTRASLDVAEELCRRAAAIEPQNLGIQAAWTHVDAWTILLRFGFSDARREAARTRARRSLELEPNRHDTRLAWAFLQVFDPGFVAPPNAAELDAALQALLRERPGDARTLLALGFLQRFSGRFEDSRRTFEELARDPLHAAAAWCEIAYMQFAARDYRAAEEAVDASLRQQAFFWNLQLKVSLALFWRGDLADAVATFEHISSDDLKEDYGLNTGLTLHAVRRDGEAMLRLVENTPREWINIVPKAVWAAGAYSLLNRDEAAAAARTTALKLVNRRLDENPSDRGLLRVKGRLLAQQGDRAEAARLLGLVREMAAKRDSGTVADLAVLQRYDEAIEELERALGEPSELMDELVPTAASLRHAPEVEPLRSHARFQALQVRMDADPKFSPWAASPAAKPDDKPAPTKKPVPQPKR